MLTRREIGSVVLVIIVLALITSLIQTWNTFFWALLGIFLVVIINVSAKKVGSFYLDSEIEVKLWEINRWGFRQNQYFKKPFPAGILFPLLGKVLTFGWINWMACLVFEVKPKIYRAARRHGLYKFSEMTEWHIGLIAAWGIFANLIFAIIFYFIGAPDFARWSVYFAFFNMIPWSDLDGNKIFFGSVVLWSFLAIVTLIGMGYVFFLV